MSLIVENGSALSDAESYVSVADFKAYCDARGLSYGDDDTAIEQSLRRATEYLDGAYRSRWAGYQATPGQALCWPRAYLRITTGMAGFGYLPSDSVPTAVIRATCECAVREVASPGGLTPDETPGEALTSISVGPISADFAAGSGGGGSTDAAPILTSVERIIAPLLRSSAGALVLRA